jgi:hypothetical protein
MPCEFPCSRLGPIGGYFGYRTTNDSAAINRMLAMSHINNGIGKACVLRHRQDADVFELEFHAVCPILV